MAEKTNRRLAIAIEACRYVMAQLSRNTKIGQFMSGIPNGYKFQDYIDNDPENRGLRERIYEVVYFFPYHEVSAGVQVRMQVEDDYTVAPIILGIAIDFVKSNRIVNANLGIDLATVMFTGSTIETLDVRPENNGDYVAAFNMVAV